MNLCEPFIRRPVMTSLVMLAILLFGILGYRDLAVSDLPNVDFPTIQAIIDNVSEMGSVEKEPKKEVQKVEEIFSLSPIQKWFFAHQHTNFNHYNQAIFLTSWQRSRSSLQAANNTSCPRALF